MTNGTHKLVIKNPKALELLKQPETCCIVIALASEKGKLIEQGDALVARDALLEAGFKWGIDFYLKVVGNYDSPSAQAGERK